MVLGHPVVVDAARELFVAVGLRNNAKGTHEDEVRIRFREPAWAYPVARFVDPDGKDLVPRTQGDWQNQNALLRRMVAALEAAKRPVPAWLALVAAEHNPAKRTSTRIKASAAVEPILDGLDGVLATYADAIDEQVVFEVIHDASVVSADALRKAARRRAPKPKALLGKHALRWVPMTRAQAGRVNAALATGKDPMAFLSPGQIDLSKRIAEAPAEALRKLEIDRTPKGLADYAARLRKALRVMKVSDR